ncbi:MAG: oligosaccharide flippase family protein, partial [Clostridia bacterium]|nr:oligosaccharide flippase family protein [Clostridia bacterium]
MKSDSIKNPSGGSGRSFVSGVLFLSLSTLIVKIIGLAYKIPMLSLLGAEGMGYFNSAYEIYALLCVISTAGLPVALSILVSADAESGRWQRVERIYRTAMALFGVVGGVGCIFMIVFAPRISGFIESPESVGAVVAIAPSLLFVCIASAVRGYFQGLSRMTPTALSQLIEAFAKLLLGVWFAREAIARGCGIAEAAAFAVLGISVGTLLSALYLLILKAINNKRISVRAVDSRKAERFNITRALLRIALPITLGSALLGFTRVIDMALIMRRLQDIGYTAAGANSVYGAYTTLAVPIFGLIPSLITPISLALVPRLSSAIEGGSLDSQSSVVSASLRMTVLLAMPASMGVAIYARQILELLFSGQSDAIDTAAPLLSLLGISILFSCIITTANAILQSYRQTSKPIIAMAVGSAVKVLVA